MASPGFYRRLIACAIMLVAALAAGANGIDIYLEWQVTLDTTMNPVSHDQPVIAINGQFPGPLINATTNDFVHVNVFNNMDEPLLFTWNGIQQRLNSWQDGVSGTNCAIEPGSNWTYVFQTKDQIGGFFYFPSINFHKAAGGFGSIRVINRNVIAVPFPRPEAEFDLLIGDWFYDSYKGKHWKPFGGLSHNPRFPDIILMNGKGPLGNPISKAYESFNVTQGKTYRLRISNVGNALSFNFRIQKHQMVLVETEGSYTNQTTTLVSLDVHVGQSYSVLVTANQNEADYYMVASPKWNMTAGAARPNPQGTFNVTNVTLSQTFILQTSVADLNGQVPRYVDNNVYYSTPETPLKLADYYVNGTGVYVLDAFPVQSVNPNAAYGVSVVTGNHKGWIEIVFKNNLDAMDSWHLDGFGFYGVGFGIGDWTNESRSTYNLYDPVVRSTVQVYPGGWSAVYAFLDNPGMWNLRSQLLKHWYLGEELYVRVYDADPNPAKERPPPLNQLQCGIFSNSPTPAPTPWTLDGDWKWTLVLEIS